LSDSDAAIIFMDDLRSRLANRVPADQRWSQGITEGTEFWLMIVFAAGSAVLFVTVLARELRHR
jgi:hypothetical protein